jgi:hypothetical protein
MPLEHQSCGICKNKKKLKGKKIEQASDFQKVSVPLEHQSCGLCQSRAQLIAERSMIF